MQKNKNTIKPKDKTKLSIKVNLTICFVIILLSGCIPLSQNDDGITFVTSPGSPPADSVVWSPVDRNMILVTAGDVGKGRADVYVLNLGTRKKQIVANSDYGDFVESTWAPDGKHILVIVRDGTKGYERGGLWIVDLDNKSSEYLANMGYSDWSPDGNTIAAFFVEELGRDRIRIDLELINVKTKSAEIIYTNDSEKYFSGLSWSPDGKNLIFVLGENAVGGDLYAINIKTRQTVKLTENEKISNPSWSPTGNVIVYESWPVEGTKTTLKLISSDGKCGIRIPNLEYVWSPTWSPDGEKLGYIGPDGIYFLEVNKVLGKDIYHDLCK